MNEVAEICKCHKCGCIRWQPTEDRPATEEDIADMQAQLAAVANDPEMTIMTTHCMCECHCKPLEYYDG